MATKRVEHTGTFAAAGNDGQQYTIYEFTEIVAVPTTGNPGGERPGIRSLQLSTGEPVNRMDKGKYEIMSSVNIPITSDDPNAP